MGKQSKLIILIAVLFVVGCGVCAIIIYLDKISAQIPSPASASTVSYLVSSADSAKYCNGVEMDSVGYQKTIVVKRSTSTPALNPTNIQKIKTVISAATTGMCHNVMNQLDIVESGGTVYIPVIDAWAGVSIVMCSCKPQVEVNLLQIPGIKKVVWSVAVNNFEECIAAGSPVMESYPRQCKYGDKTFVENIGNELQKTDLITIETPRPNQIVSSPLAIKGEARGSWFFEASFPIVLTDWDGKIIAQGAAQAKGDWMTAEFVPFEATLTFAADKNAYSNKGTLVLRKGNPSGIPENDDALEIPVVLIGDAGLATACTLEAKLCPDGSAVGRSGPNCEFTECP